jgi:hypothetical protein
MVGHRAIIPAYHVEGIALGVPHPGFQACAGAVNRRLSSRASPSFFPAVCLWMGLSTRKRVTLRPLESKQVKADAEG